MIRQELTTITPETAPRLCKHCRYWQDADGEPLDPSGSGGVLGHCTRGARFASGLHSAMPACDRFHAETGRTDPAYRSAARSAAPAWSTAGRESGRGR